MKLRVAYFLLVTCLFVSCAGDSNPVDGGPNDPNNPGNQRPGSIGRVGTTKNITDAQTIPLIFLGGGSTDQDDAMTRFASATGEGNISVIRTSGSTGYNQYLLELSDAASVETFLLNRRELADNPRTNELVLESDALFVAGGDQWTYTQFWNNTLLSASIDSLINARKIPFGGTSAGAMIWGGRYFDASDGSITSAEAMANPLDRKVSIRPALFRTPGILQDRVIDTHFTERNRQGRLMVFLARARTFGYYPSGIAIDERTAFVIDSEGVGTSYGSGFTWMYIPFGDANTNTPEVLSDGSPLTWYRDGEAVLVWKLANGQRFDLNENRPLDRPSSYFASVREGVFEIVAMEVLLD
jgi:cyanophycinase